MLELKLLGSPQILLAGRPVNGLAAAKSQALLFYLAVTGRPQSRLALAGLLWPDKREADALANLRQALYHLRNALADHLSINRLTVALNPALPCQVDALLFETEIDETNPPVVRQKALDHYTGEFLAGFYVDEAEPFEAWAVVTRERLHHLATEALHQLVMDFGGRQEIALGLRAVNHWLALEPWREEAHRHKLRFLAWDGQRQAALDYYERCCLLLKEELGATPEAATVALYEQIRAGKVTTSSVVEKKTRRLQDQPGHTPTAPTLQPEVPVHEGRQRIVTLPAPPTALIGREQTVDAVINRFRNHMGRLLTLVGPPGIGKSRLGIAVASRLQDSYRDGVYYIPLAAVNEPTLVAEVLLAAFSLTTPNAKPAQLRVIDYLKRKELLLVLDNFEQITAAAPLLAEVLSECPGVQMLVTSRERLHLRAELCYPVPTLDLVAAAELFVQRAQAVSETVVLTANEQIIVAQICQTLDCLPLALELSAARLDILSLPQILTRLHDRRLDLLTDGPRDLPPYQRTLRNAIHRSYTLLDNEEQALFRCASVFASGFELAAISTFGFHERQLQSLVSKNLVKTEIVANSERRYWLLDTLREYASEQLVVQLDGENSKPILKGVVGETYRVWSLLAFELGRLEQSEALLKQSSQLFTEIGDKARVDANAGQAGLLAFYQGDLERARALYHSGLDAASTSGQKGTMIILSHLIGTVEMRWGD